MIQTKQVACHRLLQGWGNGGYTFKGRDGYRYDCTAKCGNTGDNFQCALQTWAGWRHESVEEQGQAVGASVLP